MPQKGVTGVFGINHKEIATWLSLGGSLIKLGECGLEELVICHLSRRILVLFNNIISMRAVIF